MPKPKLPKEIKIIQGTLEKSREKETPKPEKIQGVPEMPKDLPESCLTYWNLVCGQLKDWNLLATIDIPLLKELVYNIDLMNQARYWLKEEGFVIVRDTKNGPQQTRNTWHLVYRDAFSVVEKIGGKFGFTPSDREKLTAQDKEDENPFEKLLS